MLRAREAGAPVTIGAAATVADGIAVRRAGEITLPLVNRYVDEIVTVDDEEIASAILMLLEQEKTLAEGAGAAALAAIVQSKTNLRHRRTVALVCGGNIDVTLLAKIIERGLVKDGRLLRIRVNLQERCISSRRSSRTNVQTLSKPCTIALTMVSAWARR
jgi:threonine dehydratase